MDNNVNINDLVENEKVQETEAETIETSILEPKIFTPPGNGTGKEPNPSLTSIQLTNLYDWWCSYKDSVAKSSKIFTVGLKLQGIEPSDYVVVTTPALRGGKTNDGEDRREINILSKPTLLFIPNLSPIDVKIFPTGIAIIYGLEDRVLKIYHALPQKSTIVRLPTIMATVCIPVDSASVIPDSEGQVYIPVNTAKFNKAEFGDNMSISLDLCKSMDSPTLLSGLDDPAPLEDLIIKKYSQLSSQSKDLRSCKDVISFLLKKQEGIFDIAHLYQIDDAIAFMFQ